MSNRSGSPVSVADLVQLARMNGLELSRAEAEELRPFYDQMQDWLGTLRRTLTADEEPATIVVVVAEHGADVRR